MCRKNYKEIWQMNRGAVIEDDQERDVVQERGESEEIMLDVS